MPSPSILTPLCILALAALAASSTVQQALDTTPAGGAAQLEGKVYTGSGNCGARVSKSVVLEGKGAWVTMVDCEGSGERCLVISGGGVEVVVKGMGFKGGSAPRYVVWEQGEVYAADEEGTGRKVRSAASASGG